jgi:flagellar hook protein FlgE
MMTQGYYAGISGIQTHQYGLDVISDNLANVNTIGFRGSSTEFASLFSEKLVSAGATTPTTNDIGLGTRLQATTMNTQIGSFINTDRFNDLAIGGNGWFGVASGDNQYFTRAGNFVLDEYQKNNGVLNSSVGRLTTTEGMYVMGTMLNNFKYDNEYNYAVKANAAEAGAFKITASLDEVPLAAANGQTPIELPTRLAYPTEPTTTTKFYGNLGIEPVERTMSANAISPSNDQNRIKLLFTQSAVQPVEGVSWDIVATASSNDGNSLYDTQYGQVTFNQSGALNTFTLPTLNNDGAPVTVDLGGAFGGLISSAGPSISAASQSDGVSGGTLNQYSINANGIIVADFSNGRQSAIGRIAVYHFQNDQGLSRAGNSLFSKSDNSGEPMFWTDAAGNAITGAAINSGRLENSNVELETGLTDMIIMQRAYQANAKTVTTVDEMIQKALSMRR